MPSTTPPIAGNSWTLTGLVKDSSGNLADPTGISFTVTDPLGTATVYTTGQLTHVTTGTYTLSVDCGTPGIWQNVVTATGTNRGADVVEWPVGEP